MCGTCVERALPVCALAHVHHIPFACMVPELIVFPHTQSADRGVLGALQEEIRDMVMGPKPSATRFLPWL